MKITSGCQAPGAVAGRASSPLATPHPTLDSPTACPLPDTPHPPTLVSLHRAAIGALRHIMHVQLASYFMVYHSRRQRLRVQTKGSRSAARFFVDDGASMMPFDGLNNNADGGSSESLQPYDRLDLERCPPYQDFVEQLDAILADNSYGRRPLG